jgi:hypothetical protein
MPGANQLRRGVLIGAGTKCQRRFNRLQYLIPVTSMRGLQAVAVSSSLCTQFFSWAVTPDKDKVGAGISYIQYSPHTCLADLARPG